MKKIVYLLIIVLLCGNVSLLNAQAEMYNQSAEADARCKQWVDSVFDRLSAQERMGQLFVVSIPATADKQTKKLIKSLVKRYNIGGLLFTDGVPEEQAILTNIAQKASKLPIMIGFDGGQGFAMGLNRSLRFPERAALSCIEDSLLLYEYGCEAARQLSQLSVSVCFEADANRYFIADADGNTNANSNTDANISNDKLDAYSKGLMSKGIVSVPKPGSSLLRSGMLLVPHNADTIMKQAMNDALTGALSGTLIEEKCRTVLTYKYMAGLHRPRKKLQISGMSHRINTDGARALAARLRKEAIVAPCNYFGAIPLTTTNAAPIAVLSLGGGGDNTFVEEIKRLSPVSVEHINLDKDINEEVRNELARKLDNYGRIIVSVSGVDANALAYSNLLAELNLPVPLVYAFFTSQRGVRSLEVPLRSAAAVVLGHSLDADVQHYVANVMFAKEPTHGKLAMDIGNIFKAGDGSPITVGMKAGLVMPEELGMNSYELHQIEGFVKAGLDEKAYPGCQVLVLKDGKTVYDRCYGTHSDKDTTAVRPNDMFDLAALTKTTATLLAVMKLYDEGKLRLTDRASRYLPLLRNTNKSNITIKDLLLHESGLPPYLRFYIDAIDPNSVHGPYAQSWIDKWHHTRVSEHSYFCSDFKFKRGLMSAKYTSAHTLQVADDMWMNKSFKSSMLQKIARCDVDRKRYVCSSLGFILLQQVVEAIVRLPMDLYIMKEFYAPMGLQRTMFRPLQRYTKQDVMPTAANDFLRRQDLCGYVHDEAAACMGGVSGNAGLFSTAAELAKIYQMLLNGGELNGKRYLSEATCRLFTTETSTISRRGLGFDKPDVNDQKNNYCAPSATSAVYGHTGDTGTCAWADPENGTIYVFLSNRMCPNVWNTKLGDMKIQKNIQEAIYKSMK